MALTLPTSLETVQRDAERLIAALNAAPPGPSGVLRVDILGDERTILGSHTVRFDAVAVVAAPGVDPDAVLVIGLDDLVRLAAGAADGALLYLSGEIDVSGDESLVLALGSALRVQGSARALIDPAALDPIAVSAAIADAPLEHLDRVMAGGFRELILTEVFRRLPDFLIAEKAARVQVAVMFEIERGEIECGEIDALDRYVVRIAEGICVVQTGAEPDEPVDATLVLAGHEFLRLVLGHLNPVRGVLSGQIRVRGQVLKALGFNSVMSIPGS